MGLEEIGSEVQKVFASLGIDRFPIGLTEAYVVRRALCRRTQGPVVELGGRSDRVEESANFVADAAAADVNGDFLGHTLIHRRFDAMCELAIGLLPSNSLP